MLYRTLEINELINLKDSDREIVELMENNGSHLKLAALKKHQEIEAHMSHADVCIYVIDGEIEIIFDHEDNCTCQACSCTLPDESDDDVKKYKIKKGQLFMLEKNVAHSVKAEKDSTFMIIKI